MSVLKKGRPWQRFWKGFGFADNLFCNEHKVEMERKKKKKSPKPQKKKLKDKMQGRGRGRNKGIRTCCSEGCLCPTRATNNKQKTKAVGFLNNSIFRSPKKETTKGPWRIQKTFQGNWVVGYQWAHWLNIEQTYSGRPLKTRCRASLDWKSLWGSRGLDAAAEHKVTTHMNWFLLQKFQNLLLSLSNIAMLV